MAKKPELPKLTASAGLDIPWCEYAGIGNTSAGDAGFKPNDNRATMPILLYEENLDEAPGKILGYPRVEGEALKRQFPWTHPRWNWMFATQIASIKGMGPVGVLGGRGTHQLYMVTVVFEVPNYDVLPDGGYEYNRWVEKRIKPSASFLTLNNAEYEFASTDQVPEALRGAPVKQGTSLLVQDALLTWTWRHVPDTYVMDDAGHPDKFMKAIGKVNDGFFAGCPKGTLLLEAIDPEPVSAPVSPESVNSRTRMPRLWDITISMKFRNPPTTPGGAISGWNLAPAPADPKGLWYPMVSRAAGALTGKSYLYQETHFPNLFKSVQAED